MLCFFLYSGSDPLCVFLVSGSDDPVLFISHCRCPWSLILQMAHALYTKCSLVAPFCVWICIPRSKHLREMPFEIDLGPIIVQVPTFAYGINSRSPSCGACGGGGISVFLGNLDLAKIASTKPGRSEPRKRDSAFPIKRSIECFKMSSMKAWAIQFCGIPTEDPSWFNSMLPGYFSQTKYRSLQRQLNQYGFERITKGPLEQGSYHHPYYFVRDNPALWKRMRSDKKVGKKSSTTGSAAEPQTSTPEELPIPPNCTMVSRSPYSSSTSIHSSTSELNVWASSPDQQRWHY